MCQALVAGLRAERDELANELDSASRGGDTNAKLVREKGEQLAEKRVEMEALSRKNGQGLAGNVLFQLALCCNILPWCHLTLRPQAPVCIMCIT